MNWKAIFVRTTEHPLDAAQISKQTQAIANGATSSKTRGLTARVKILQPEIKNDINIYKAEISVSRKLKRAKPNTREVSERYFEEALVQMKARAQSRDWIYLEPNENISNITDKRREIVLKYDTSFALPPLTSDIYNSVFGRIYDRDSHIRTIYLGLQTAFQTNFAKRRHCLLYGPPAAAKSELLQAFVKWIGQDSENVLSLDATTCSKAGIEKLILEKSLDGTLPRVLYLEEVEKVTPTHLLCLLQIMDRTGRITRTNARIGNVSAKADIVILSTCNDLNKLQQFEGGALLSRYNLKLYCARPNRILMKKILEREATEMGITINDATTEKILAFGFDILQTNDPRRMISFLDGYDNIDDYLADQLSILQDQKEDEAIQDQFI
jgi:hypothetical protein